MFIKATQHHPSSLNVLHAVPSHSQLIWICRLNSGADDRAKSQRGRVKYLNMAGAWSQWILLRLLTSKSNSNMTSSPHSPPCGLWCKCASYLASSTMQNMIWGEALHKLQFRRPTPAVNQSHFLLLWKWEPMGDSTSATTGKVGIIITGWLHDGGGTCFCREEAMSYLFRGLGCLRTSCHALD